MIRFMLSDKRRITNQQLRRLLFVGGLLADAHKQGQPEPELAKSWNIELKKLQQLKQQEGG